MGINIESGVYLGIYQIVGLKRITSHGLILVVQYVPSNSLY